MVWAKGAVALGMAVAVGAGTPAWADSLVVRSSGPSAGSYTPGKKLADGGALLLKAGDVVTLLDAKGTGEGAQDVVPCLVRDVLDHLRLGLYFAEDSGIASIIDARSREMRRSRPSSPSQGYRASRWSTTRRATMRPSP